jgi:hypothetical protein
MMMAKGERSHFAAKTGTAVSDFQFYLALAGLLMIAIVAFLGRRGQQER